MPLHCSWLAAKRSPGCCGTGRSNIFTHSKHEARSSSVQQRQQLTCNFASVTRKACSPRACVAAQN